MSNLVLKIHHDVDYDRQYQGKTTTIDRSIGLLSGVSEKRSDGTNEAYAPKIIVSATPKKRVIRRVVKPDFAFADLEASSDPSATSEAMYIDEVVDTMAIVIKDTEDDSLMIREEVDDSYSYAYGLGRVTTRGYKYVPNINKIIHKVRQAAEKLGVSEQLGREIDRQLQLTPLKANRKER